MPFKNDGMSVFVRSDKLTDADWYRLIESRRGLIRQYLDSFTLRELGQLPCMRSGCRPDGHDLNSDDPEVRGRGLYSLKTQGIFRVQLASAAVYVTEVGGYRPWKKDYQSLDGTKQVWGLGRHGGWLLAEVRFLGKPGPDNKGYQQAWIVTIEESDVPTIIKKTKETPQQIWGFLGLQIREWTKRRKHQYEEMLGLEEDIEREETLLRLHSVKHQIK